MSSTSTTDTSVSSSEEETLYRSPMRCLAASFRKGRDKWKKKAQDRNQAVKVLKVRVHDLQQSREHHRQQAQQAQQLQGQLEQQVQQLQTEVEQLRTQREELTTALGKKK